MMNAKHYFVILLLIPLSLLAYAQQIQVTKIWDNAPHNAFTDLIRYNDKFYCTFREGTGHVPGETGEDGKIRILISDNGEKWKSLALLKKKGYDLRDSKLSITPDGRLMVLMGGSVYDGNILLSRLTHVSFLNNKDNTFSKLVPVEIDEKIRTQFDWLWRVSWFNGTGYGVVYQIDGRKSSKAFLLKTHDGINYSSITELDIDGLPNEATVYVKPDGEMLILMRRELGDKNGKIGHATPPYKQWEWNDLGIRLGGPNIIPVSDTTFIMGTRTYTDDVYRTALFFTEKSGSSRHFLELPSGGDTSYPGMVIYNDTLWVSYYSSHEEKSKIYLAKVPMSYINNLLLFGSEYESKKIWDHAPHNAFTDLIRYNNKFYCTFREGTGHVPGEIGEDGKIRILISDDGEKWESMALLEKKDYDLRDSKLSVTPDGRLMVLMGGSNYDGYNLINRRGHVSFLEKNGKEFTEPQAIVIDEKIRSDFDWLWRVTWFENVGYGVVYRKKNKVKSDAFLVKTINGINYTLVSALFINNIMPGESTVSVNPNGEMTILMRCDGGDQHGLIGSAMPPYTSWEWNDLGMRLGGPNIIPFNDTTFIMGTRSHEKKEVCTALYFVEKSGFPRKIVELPSGGDTSYPGMVIYNNTLWVSYYSSHEGKSKIYLAKLPMQNINKLFMANAKRNTTDF